jgi:hypothetical protein
MAISFPQYKTSVSGTPGLTPRFLRIAAARRQGRDRIGLGLSGRTLGWRGGRIAPR